jgi:hypothetical protein
MVLVGRNGSTRERRFEMKVKRDGELVKTYARFTYPSDVAGTQLVVIDTPNQLDEQLLYLPALKRTSRIAGRARSGSFMGSDFSFEDMELNGDLAGSHTMVSSDDVAWIIDTIPLKGSSYGRIRSHVRRADYFPVEVEFFDRKDRPIKRLTVEETRRDGDVITPVRSTMKNLKKGTQTHLEVLEYAIGPDLVPDDYFTTAWMERHG